MEILIQLLYPVSYDMVDQAFQLAEDYRDFVSLADLCHSSSPIFPLTANKYANRLTDYVEKYKEEFCDKLYQWYLEHGKILSVSSV